MRYRNILEVTLTLVMLLAPGSNSFGYPEPGTNAPPFKNPIKWFNTHTPDGVDLRGKVVVLQFWGTWCATCRLAIPQLNDLSRRFGGDSVIFILLSDESPQVVEQFLAVNAVHSAVGCDTTGETFEAYDIRPIPRTFLIDKYGVVAWYGHPNSITADALGRYLKSGDVPSMAFESDSLRIPELVQTSEPGFSLAVNHAQSGDRFGRNSESSIIECEEGGRYEIEFKGRQLSEIISRLSGEPRTRIQFVPPLEFEPTLDLSLDISRPMEYPAGRSKAVEALCDALGLRIRSSESIMSGWTMTIGSPGYLVNAAAPGSTTRRDGNQWTGSGITLGQLGEHLESLLAVIIWNDTSMDGEYDFLVPVADVGATRKVLLTKYGIALDSASRPVNILVLEPKR